MSNSVLVTFIAGITGDWRIDSVDAVSGGALPAAPRLSVIEGAVPTVPADAGWTLRGATSNTRYTTRSEVNGLVARQEGLHRPEATCAALIPIRKTAVWWALAQDERRAIFEEQSRHIAIGMEYLPPIARRLHHCREFGESFDFLTWFEFAPQHADGFEALVRRLRQTAEWRFVEREVDIRLSRTL